MDQSVILFIAVFAFLFLSLLTLYFVRRFNEFRRELRYLNTEIGRTEGRERRHYEKLKRKLYLSLIPFVSYRGD